MLAWFPDAERVEVPSHQDVPGLHGNPGSVGDRVRNKREVQVVGTEKSQPPDPTAGRPTVDLVARTDGAEAGLATAFVNRELLDPRGGTRVRFPLMPEPVARSPDRRTSTVEERIAATDDLVAAGYVDLRYRAAWKARWREQLVVSRDELPGCRVRYAF